MARGDKGDRRLDLLWRCRALAWLLLAWLLLAPACGRESFSPGPPPLAAAVPDERFAADEAPGRETLLPGGPRPAAPPQAPAPPPPPAAGARIQLLVGATTASKYLDGFYSGDFTAWRERTPGVQPISIPSTSDGQPQPALFYDPGSPEPRPLLVVLHTWSTDWLQNVSIPFATFAIANDWIFLHPQFRGANREPTATASDLAVADVLDAVDHVQRRARVDPARVYLVGLSGGAMMSLVMAGRHPQRWAGVAAWVPIYDLVDWYAFNRAHGRRYAHEIEASCGGVPRRGTRAAAACRLRSPSAWLSRARDTPVRILIAHGIDDQLVLPSHALRAFNDLARPEDRFTAAQMRYIDAERQLPAGLEPVVADDTLFAEAGAPVLFERTSGGVQLVLFQGGHDLLYNPGLQWLSRQRRR